MTAQRRLLGGRYEIGGILGYGGMAEVHRGSDLRLGRDVAVKMLRTDLARDETFLTRFRREAQNAASLNHPSIVAVYDTGEDSSNGTPVPYIVMEYVEGRTLKELLIAEGRLTPRRACEIVADACAALDFSHRHQIIHRDVKPGNVMLSSNGQVKVMDFGIARAMASGQATMTQTSAVIGTAQYLSPEQARGETVDARSDVYATGCLLFELLCGDPPFTGDNPVSVAYQHVREPPTPPSHINPDVPPAVDAIVLKALAKNKTNRYQSAGEMREDLERAIAGRPVLATPLMGEEERTQLLEAAGSDDQTRLVPAAVEEPGKKRHIGRNIALAFMALLLVAGLGFGGWYLANRDKVDVPNVMDLPRKEAEQKITALGLEVAVTKKESDSSKKGLVLNQDPKGKARVAKGTTVNLEVGGGPDLIKLPDLTVYKTKEAAQNALTDLGLESKFEDVSSQDPAGTVIGQDPKAGEEVSKDQVVTIEVSDGSIKTVPDVSGMDADAACGQLQDSGFSCKTELVEADADMAGKVVGQSPAPGTTQAGGEVTIQIGGIKVPDFQGKTVADAKKEAAELNLAFTPTDAADDWKVTKQDKAAGEIVEKGTTVTLTAEKDGLP